MPLEPIRERAMAAIAAQLETIEAGTVVYPSSGHKPVDYWTTPSLITRALLWLPQYDQPLAAGSPTTQLDIGPVVGIVRASGSEFERIMHTDPAGPISAGYEHRQHLTVWGYVKGTTALLASTLLERLWQDVLECLMVDPTLGGLLLTLEPMGPLDTDDGAMEPLGFFAQDWRAVA